MHVLDLLRRRSSLAFAVLLILMVGAIAAPSSAHGQFRRGDVNDDGNISLFDVCLLIDHLFVGTPITCADAADADDDGGLSTGDATYLLAYLCTSGSPPPPAPGPMVCGPDPTPDPLSPCGYTSCGVLTLPPNSRFIRGDCNSDLSTGVGDAIFMLTALFVPGGPVPPCGDACDAQDDGLFDLSDAVYLLTFLFQGGPPPPPPFPGCGCDPTECGLMEQVDCRSGPCP